MKQKQKKRKIAEHCSKEDCKCHEVLTECSLLIKDKVLYVHLRDSEEIVPLKEFLQ